MQKADDISSTTLVVGKFYLVNCAVIKNHNDFVFYVPVIGKEHNDPQFGVEFNHVHVDGRFCDEGYGSYKVDNLGRTNGIVRMDEAKEIAVKLLGFEYKRRKCRRLTTGIKPPLHNKKYTNWYNGFVGKDCKGKKCPHLGTTMLQHGDNLICPLHNLKGDCKTEKIIPYDI